MRKPNTVSLSWTAHQPSAKSSDEPNRSGDGTADTCNVPKASSSRNPSTSPGGTSGSNSAAAMSLRAKLGGKLKPSAASAKHASDSNAAFQATGPHPSAPAFAPHDVPGSHSATRASSASALHGAGDPSIHADQSTQSTPTSGQATGRKQKRFERFGEHGQKERHLREDDQHRSLNELVCEQKQMSEPDVDARMAANVLQKGSSFRQDDVGADDEYDLDSGVQLLEPPKRNKRSKHSSDLQSQQSQQSQKLEPLSSRCNLCFANQRKPKHLHIAYGERSYLMLPLEVPLVKMQSRIVPMEHSPSMRMADEDVTQDVRNFKKSLISMHGERGEECLFLETARGIQQQKYHGTVDCIPVPKGSLQDAPLYFKKALQEEESDWATHAAKAAIATSGSFKGLHSAIPEHFPYFHVEFGLDGGYVHVLDNEERWDALFGHKVACSILEEPEHMARRKGKRWNVTEELQSEIHEFLSAWSRHDWTAELDVVRGRS